MNICLYRNGAAAGTIDLPEIVYAACLTLDRWLAEQDGDCTVYGLGHVARRDARIAELEGLVRGAEVNRKAWKESAISKDARIAELEKQAAIDKTLLALADARINRELRDDFAGRALQSIPGDPSGADGFTLKERATWSFRQADEMLKAKGGA